MRRSVVRGSGSYLPDRVMTNFDLEKIVETSDEWIRQRSGISERRIAGDELSTSMMAIEAAKNALAHGNLQPDDIDGIVVATSTPDHTFPSVATMVQAALDIPFCPAFDIQAVCTGFVYALSIADNLVTSGGANRVLVIGAEKMSSILNWEDRTTCVLFGDGAGAIVIQAQDTEDDPKSKSARGVLSSHLYANGKLKDILHVNGGPSTTGLAGHIVMEGKEVFRHAVQLMSSVVAEALEQNDLSADEIDWLVPHQANIRIIDAMQKKMQLPSEKVIRTVAAHANTSAASIPLALATAVGDGRVQNGDLLAMEAIGGGLVWGAALVKFGRPS